jgi:hypothetical protein
MEEYLSQIINLLVDLSCDGTAHWPESQRTMPPRHRFKNPFTMSKIGGQTPPTGFQEAWNRIWFVSYNRMNLPGGAYRDRTDDPLLAKQVLSQLS